jgi:hypothetical protein
LKFPAVVAVCVTFPEVVSAPDHAVPFAPPPLAVHAVAPVDDHVTVKELPMATFAGLAETAAVGGVGVPTVSVVDALAGPWFGSMLWHVTPSVNVPVVMLLSPTLPFAEPRAPTKGPLNAFPPDATQPEAFVEDHVIVNAWPVATVDGVTEIAAVGADGGSTVMVIGADVALVLAESNAVQVSVTTHDPGA